FGLLDEAWVLAEKLGSGRLAKQVQFALDDDPVLRIGRYDLALGQRGRTIAGELRCVARWFLREPVPVLGRRKQIPLVVPYVRKLRFALRRRGHDEVRYRVIALHRQRHVVGSRGGGET